MFREKERQTMVKEKEIYFLRKKLNIIEKKRNRLSNIVFFQQFMYKNIKVSVTLTLTLKVSRGLNYFSLNTL